MRTLKLFILFSGLLLLSACDQPGADVIGMTPKEVNAKYGEPDAVLLINNDDAVFDLSKAEGQNVGAMGYHYGGRVVMFNIYGKVYEVQGME